ncbi:MAG: DUF1801 domain-containing protein [Cytophagales bacterium]|nr:DUF1801 domain-containing protein [Cytophagales bacterium]
MNPKVDAFLLNAKKWREELTLLRSIVMDSGLGEELKWGAPCYVREQANVIIIQGFKDYFALLFFKGALMEDPQDLLRKPGENTQSGRQIRMTSMDEMLGQEEVLRAYIQNAIEVEKAGEKVVVKKTEEYAVPLELEESFATNSDLQHAFFGLTPGRQRAYLLHFAEAKQSATRKARIEKYAPRILKGKGILDCWCGLSKRMPACDGSHKQLG